MSVADFESAYLALTLAKQRRVLAYLLEETITGACLARAWDLNKDEILNGPRADELKAVRYIAGIFLAKGQAGELADALKRV